MEIKTKYNIGDACFLINSAQRVGLTFALTKITEIRLVKNEIVYKAAGSSKLFSEKDIVTKDEIIDLINQRYDEYKKEMKCNG